MRIDFDKLLNYSVFEDLLRMEELCLRCEYYIIMFGNTPNEASDHVCFEKYVKDIIWSVDLDVEIHIAYSQ